VAEVKDVEPHQLARLKQAVVAWRHPDEIPRMRAAALGLLPLAWCNPLRQRLGYGDGINTGISKAVGGRSKLKPVVLGASV
jgi:hypothetical protein